MGTIKIGSSSDRKGITIDPKTILFNGNVVKKITYETKNIWHYNLLATIELINVNHNGGRVFIYSQKNSDGTKVEQHYIDEYNGSYINLYWNGANGSHTCNLKGGYLYVVDINENTSQLGTITSDGEYTNGTIASNVYPGSGNVIATVKVYPLD